MFYRLLGAALLVGIGVLVGGAIFADQGAWITRSTCSPT